ncbi:MAG: SDR family oxidoreductase [Thermoactinomyces sp.]
MSKRFVLITGASSGIGEAIAQQLVKQGDYPILVARNKDKLRDLKQKLKDCSVYSCDVTREDEVKQMVDAVIQGFGKIDVLINNAGMGAFGGTLEIPFSDYAQMIETNYLGAVRLTAHLLPHMLLAGGGRIINIASMAGLTGIPNLAGYCASKFALIGFSESLKLEYSPVIRVGVLCPGPVRTPFFGGKDPYSCFPPFIAKRMLDADTVARYAIRLIERPRLLVIPRSLKWALRLRQVCPDLYLQVTRWMYGSWMKKGRDKATASING